MLRQSFAANGFPSTLVDWANVFQTDLLTVGRDVTSRGKIQHWTNGEGSNLRSLDILVGLIRPFDDASKNE
ncbi:hypothetical protein TNCV_540601 [Trichonephila clavipes]|nr:hypothetical protein TNCV_540601 [Trichonephila clavipes]